MSTLYDVIRRPVVTEKGLGLKERERTLCFEVMSGASKQQIQQAVEHIFKVQVDEVRTMVVRANCGVVAAPQATNLHGRKLT